MSGHVCTGKRPCLICIGWDENNREKEWQMRKVRDSERILCLYNSLSRPSIDISILWDPFIRCEQVINWGFYRNCLKDLSTCKVQQEVMHLTKDFGDDRSKDTENQIKSGCDMFERGCTCLLLEQDLTTFQTTTNIPDKRPVNPELKCYWLASVEEVEYLTFFMKKLHGIYFDGRGSCNLKSSFVLPKQQHIEWGGGSLFVCIWY